MLATHAVAGAAAALIVRSNPILGFFVACASHFLLDAIPHWDYPIRSLEHDPKTLRGIRISFDRLFVKDFFRAGVDASIGAALSFAIIRPADGYTALIASLGIIGGMIPDFLQLVYYALKREPFISIQRFHSWTHSDIRLYGTHNIVGIGSQIVLMLLISFSMFNLAT